MSLACSQQELEQLLAEVAFTRNFGFILEAIGDGECRIDVPFQPAFERPGGVDGHGRLLTHSTVTYIRAEQVKGQLSVE